MKIISGLQYYKYNGDPYCTECYKKRAATCFSCNKEIVGKIYSAMNKTFHIDCFKCTLCSKAFQDDTFIPFNELAFHPDCYKAKYTKDCVICKKEIWGEYLYVEGGCKHYKTRCVCFTYLFLRVYIKSAIQN